MYLKTFWDTKKQQNPTQTCSWIVEVAFGTIKPRDLELLIADSHRFYRILFLSHSRTSVGRSPGSQFQRTPPSSRFLSDIPGHALLHTVTRSAQAFHLFPYSPQSSAAPTALYSVFKFIHFLHYSTWGVIRQLLIMPFFNA